MLAVPGPVPTGPDWAFEFKWDGVRAIVEVRGAAVRTFSRGGRDVTAGYPELATLPDLLGGRHAVLDGEIVAIGGTGVPSFAVLQQRMHVPAPATRLLAGVPVQLYVFDVLALDGRGTADLPYRRRRELLDGLGLRGPVVHAPPHFTGHGGDVLTAARETGLEGVVAKRLDSPYRPGIRSPHWVKTPLTVTTEVVVVGWKPGAGRRTGTVGSLLMGGHDADGRLTYLGHVGTGLTEAALDLLRDRLAPLARATPPLDPPPPREYARGARWVQPVLVGEVAYRAVTPDGRLRHPSWRGLRTDRDPREVGRPDPR
ncbi:non-homologous end-joining DNA ligase [Planosporangium sp. 12N6]|uniref:non-homologous end-joining DNA ligase n=1 Tax=Planosporangium spinosum TaxID=3402278 RepID=UPI003CF33996